MGDEIKEILENTAKQAVSEVSNKPIALLCDIVSHWLKHRFKETISKNLLEDVEESAIQNEIQKRCKELAEKIPTNQLISPDKQITTAALDSMLFCADDLSMRDMFVNIMVSTIDSSRRKYAHPSFPHILKQLSPLDAQVFSLIKPKHTYPITKTHCDNCLKLDGYRYVVIEDSGYILENSNTALSFTVLSMLGLIKISDERVTMKTNFSNGEASACLTPISAEISLTPLGTLFYKCCLGDEQ